MILYFTGTGNSRYAAQAIQSITGDELVSMNDLMKKGGRVALRAEQPFVFVCPVYAWRIPRVVDNFLRNADLAGNKRAYFILTCGEKAGDAVRSIKTLCIKKGLEFMGLASVVMPENYVAMFPVPGKEKADEVLQKATPHIFSLAKEIKAGRALRENKPGLVDTFQSGAVNPIFYAFVVSAKKFHATDACTHCGRCAVLCALNNISLVDGKPRWGRKCTHCMACICGCPAKAIEYGTKTQGRPRYYNTGFRQ